MAEPLRLDAQGWRRDGCLWRPALPFYAVIGDPVAHSLSPRLHTAALAERGLSHEYLALAVPAGQLGEFKERSEELAGFNVTAPHKEAVAALCDGRTDQARDLGAVNTVRVDQGRWLGVGPLAWICSDVAEYSGEDPSAPSLGSRPWLLPGGDGMHREVTIDRLWFEADGSIRPVVPTLGSVPARPID